MYLQRRACVQEWNERSGVIPRAETLPLSLKVCAKLVSRGLHGFVVQSRYPCLSLPSDVPPTVLLAKVETRFYVHPPTRRLYSRRKHFPSWKGRQGGHISSPLRRYAAPHIRRKQLE